ncbi:hypothetical protein B0H17DRAFT_1129461 [Mycena rosella]|uniref:Uncharacterized protein n=1 Tax=Mycena rosella TaxID=1033263 RepID=A0AAD7DTX6_MYCRO|nr:hypothetical protein B0H17DRAFT_1129461 [Mycena rosella]
MGHPALVDPFGIIGQNQVLFPVVANGQVPYQTDTLKADRLLRQPGPQTDVAKAMPLPLQPPRGTMQALRSTGVGGVMTARMRTGVLALLAVIALWAAQMDRMGYTTPVEAPAVGSGGAAFSALGVGALAAHVCGMMDDGGPLKMIGTPEGAEVADSAREPPFWLDLILPQIPLICMRSCIKHQQFTVLAHRPWVVGRGAHELTQSERVHTG